MTWPISIDKYLGFLTVMAAMAIMPGPAVLFAVAAGMTRGRKGALLATLGMNLAALVWFICSALGLVVLASTVPWIFRLAGWIGVLYIGWLGGEALLAATRRDPAAPAAMKTPGVSVFRDGFLVQATNPKALLFFTAVLPPFVDLGRPIWPQMAAFALGLFALDGTAMMTYGLLGAAFAHKMNEPRFRRMFSLAVGTILLLVACLMLARF